MPSNKNQAAQKIEKKPAGPAEQVQLLRTRIEGDKKNTKKNTVSVLTNEKTKSQPASPDQTSAAINESAERAYIKDNFEGLAIPLLGVALGAFLFHRMVMKDPSEKDVTKAKGALDKTRKALSDKGMSNKQVMQHKAYKAEKARIEEMQREIEEVKKRQSEAAKNERSKLKKARTKMKNMLAKYKKLLKKHNQGKLGKMLGLATGSTFALILMSYATSSNVRKYFQTNFGIPDIAKFAVGGKMLLDHLKNSMQRIESGKSTIRQEFAAISEIFDALKNMKHFTAEIAKENPKLNFDPVLMNELSPYALNYLFKQYDLAAKTGELEIEGITDPAKKKQLYLFVGWLKSKFGAIKEQFAIIKAKNKNKGKIYQQIDTEDINVRAALSLLMYKDKKQTYWHEVRGILAARIRLIGWYPQARDVSFLGWRPFESKGARFLAKWATPFMGSSEYHHGRLMYHYINRSEKLLTQLNGIIGTKLTETDVIKARKNTERMQDKYQRVLADSTKGPGSVAATQALQNLRQAETAYDTALKKGLSPAQIAELDKLTLDLDQTRKTRIQLELANAHRLAQHAETYDKRVKNLEERIKKAKQDYKTAKKIPANKAALVALETKRERLKHRLDELIAKKENVKNEAIRRISAANNLQPPAVNNVAHQGEIRPEQLDEFQKHCKKNANLIQSIQNQPDHPYWKRMESGTGIPRPQIIDYAIRTVNETARWTKGFHETLTKGGFFKKIPVVKSIQKGHFIASRGLAGFSIINDASNGRWWAVGETGATMIPVAGDFIDIGAAIWGKDWAGRTLTGTQRLIRGGIGSLSLLANIMTGGWAGTAGKALLKGGTVGIKIVNKATGATGVKRLVYNAGAWTMEKAGKTLIHGGQKLKTSVYLASYPLLGWTLYESVTPMVQKYGLAQIATKSFESSVRLGMGIMKVSKKILDEDPNIIKGINPQSKKPAIVTEEPKSMYL